MPASLSAMAAALKAQPKLANSKKSELQKTGSKLLKSSEFVDESDLNSETESEEDSDSDTTPKLPTKAIPVVKKSVAVGKKDAITPGSSSTSDENETDEEVESVEDESASSQSDSDESRDSESDSEEGTSEVSDEEMEDTVDQTERTSSTSMRLSPPPVTTNQAQANALINYIPPSGFEPVAQLTQEDLKLWERFNSANLQGKQIWHITAPAKVPITSIKRVSMRDVRMGKPSLSFNGQEFVFVQDTADNTPKLAVPDVNEKAYRTNRRGIDLSLHLQQLVKLPGQAEGGSTRPATSKQYMPAKRPIREQPEGLKMRFRPIGFGSGHAGTIGSSPSSSNSQESSDGEGSSSSDAPLPQRKKHIPAASTSTQESSDEESSDTDSPAPVERTSAPVVPKRKLEEVNGSEKINGEPTTNGNSEKKARLSSSSTNGHEPNSKEAVPAVSKASAATTSSTKKSSAEIANGITPSKGSKNKRSSIPASIAGAAQPSEADPKLASSASPGPKKITPILPPSRKLRR